jgi:hypothetical protein
VLPFTLVVNDGEVDSVVMAIPALAIGATDGAMTVIQTDTQARTGCPD